MKRILAAILCILYMAVATSATVHIHYCMGRKAGMSLINHDKDRCSKCGMKQKLQKKGCCHDEHKTLKAADHQAGAIHTSIVQQAIVAILPVHLFYYRAYTFTKAARQIPVAHAPPLWQSSCPIYLQVRNIRI